MSNPLVTEGNFALLDNTYFSADVYPQTYNQLLTLGSDCNSVFNKCQGYDPCISYTALLYQKPPTGISYQNLDNYASDIVAYTVIINFVDHVELFDLCTSKLIRGRGITKNVAQQVIPFAFKLFPVQYAWLGLMFDNPSFEAAARVYSAIGFGSPVIAQTTPGGLSVSGKSFISMFYSIAVPTNPSEVLARIFELRIQYYSCTTPYYISPKLIAYFKQLIFPDTGLGNPWEVAGAIGSIGSIDVDGIPHYYLAVMLPLVEGDKDRLTVDPPPDEKITFHTHPLYCYLRYGCYVGWPSAPDMLYTVKSYYLQGTLINFVVTVEGIYNVKLSNQFMEVLDHLYKEKMNKCLEIITKSILNKFLSIDKFREIKEMYTEMSTVTKVKHNEFIKYKDIQRKEKVRRDYFSVVDSYTFKELIDEFGIKFPTEKADTMTCITSLKFKYLDFRLFEVGFISWETAESSVVKGLLTSYNPGKTCPVELPIDTRKPYVY